MTPTSHQTVRLSAGRHSSPEHGVCVMELASMLAGERFTDRPDCVSPSLAAVLRGYNDGLDDARRQTLKAFAAASVGTRAGRAAERRRRAHLAAILGPGAGGGAWAAVRRRVIAASPYATAVRRGRAVAMDGDDALHAETLALLDELVAIGRPALASDLLPSAPPERAGRGC
jgi:hypothetical protein